MAVVEGGGSPGGGADRPGRRSTSPRRAANWPICRWRPKIAAVRASRAAAGTDAAADESACGGTELGGPRVEASGGVVL
jgi:hypothetical protein